MPSNEVMGPVFSASASGLPTVAMGGRNLHSTRDPRVEARRFIEARESSGKRIGPGSLVLLVGACLDYLAECLSGFHEGIDIVSIQLSSDFRGRERPGARLHWYAGERESLDGFLLSLLDPDELSPLVVLEWQPGMEAFPEEARAVREALARALSRNASEAATTRASGRRWIANAVRNFLGVEELVMMGRLTAPVLVLGAGPSLPEALALLEPLRESFHVIAVSSAAAAALARGIVPDLVVNTDPGWWSFPHLATLAGRSIPVAMPLSACQPWHASPILVVDQGLAFESELAGRLGPALRLPSHGTVSGSALFLAATMGSGPIVVAGFDFAATASESHARPHAFDGHILSAEGRLRPGEGLRWSRLSSAHPEILGDSGWRTSRSLGIYASAIASDAVGIGGRLWRLCPSPVDIPGARPLDPAGLTALSLATGRKAPSLPLRPVSATDDRRGALPGILATWRREARDYLDQGPDAIVRQLPIADLLRCIDLPDWAALRRAGRRGLWVPESAARLLDEVETFLAALEKRWIA